MNPKKQESPLRFSNEQILFLSIIAVLLVVILLLGITITRNEFAFKPASTLEERRRERQVKKFETVYNYILATYVEEVDDYELLSAALLGMANYLNDPYADYALNEDAMHLQESVQGDYGGIGLELRYLHANSSVVVVSTIYDNGVAKRAGAMVGDHLLMINGQPITGKSLDEITYLLRGAVGSQLELSLLRDEQLLSLRMKREKVEVPTVFFDFIDEGLGYVKITQFTPKTAQALEHALLSLNRKGLRHLILDLRDNQGGELESAIHASDLFLSEGTIVETRSRAKAQTRLYKANSAISIASDVPIVILINQNTASAAEVMAGALQDLGRATIYGRGSYGKSSVQAVLVLDSQPSEYFTLTVAHYYTASGRNISVDGIIPDYRIPSPFPLTQGQVNAYNQLILEPSYQALLSSLDEEEFDLNVVRLAREWLLPVDFLLWDIRYKQALQELPQPLYHLTYDYALATVVKTLQSAP